MKTYRGFKVKVDNKMRSHGETDFKKKLIRINKKKHKHSKKLTYSGKKVDDTLIDTLAHETYHVNRPKATEKITYKAVPKKKKRLTPAQKKRLYRLISK